MNEIYIEKVKIEVISFKYVLAHLFVRCLLTCILLGISKFRTLEGNAYELE